MDDASRERDTADSERLIGAWRLESWCVTLADGSAAEPFGPGPIGMLAYTEAGTVHAHFSRSGRARLELEFSQIQHLRRVLLGIETSAPAGVDIAAKEAVFLRAALEFNGYCGQFRVRNGTVQHAVEVAVIPEWEGVVLERDIRFDDDKLVLSTDNPDQKDELTWRRMAHTGSGQAVLAAGLTD